ncbi:MAG: glycosyltransferase [Promethearchaeota archaeon]
MKVCIVHYRLGDLDGVSLEMDKWRQVLTQLGHDVRYLAGSIGNTDGYEIPDLCLDFKPISKIQSNAFSEFVDFKSDAEFKVEINRIKDRIKQKIQNYFDAYPLDLLIPNNLFCLPMNIPASLALAEIIEEKNLNCINVNHDFYWERTNYQPTISLIQEYLDKIFPPRNPNIKHVVINSLAQKQLKKRKGLEATVIPNVFYFNKEDWEFDNFNADLRNKLGISPNDIIILQATRILKRKGIELIADLISQLNTDENLKILRERPLYDGRAFGYDNNIILVLPNLVEGFESEYKEKIENKLKNEGIKYRFCNQFFESVRIPEPDKKYSLWDSYVHADIVSFPSLQEGWGNQFLEAIKARLPIVVFEYDVYKADIKVAGFDTISLGSEIKGYDESGLVTIPDKVLNEAAKKIIRFLQNAEYRERIVTKNYEIGLNEYSLSALARYIKPLLKKFEEDIY